MPTSANINILKRKEIRLFVLLSGFFVANAIIAEFMGVKIFSLEKVFGYEPLSISLFGEAGLSFNLSAGVLTWPFVFVMTDIINEYFGIKGVRILSYLTAGLIGYGFLMFYFSIELDPADFWLQSHISPNLSLEEADWIKQKVGDYDYAFRLIFGQGLWIIFGSLAAFLTSQFADVYIFQKIKKITGEKGIWLRATGSTLVSQLIDSFIVLFIAFYIGAGWSVSTVFAIGLLGYIYKFVMAVIMTPVIYLIHFVIDKYLGEELSLKLRKSALEVDE